MNDKIEKLIDEIKSMMGGTREDNVDGLDDYDNGYCAGLGIVLGKLTSLKSPTECKHEWRGYCGGKDLRCQCCGEWKEDIVERDGKSEDCRCDKCGKTIPSDYPRLGGENGNICMGCEFKKPEEIIHWYRDGDTVEAEFDGCMYYGELKGGFVENPKPLPQQEKSVECPKCKAEKEGRCPNCGAIGLHGCVGKHYPGERASISG